MAAFIASFSMIVMAPVIYTAAVDFTLNMLVEGFGPETRGILLLPPKWLIVIFISTDVLSGKSFSFYLVSWGGYTHTVNKELTGVQ